MITSQVANQVVDIMGATFLHRLTRDTGREVHEVVKAWLIAARLAGHDDVLRQLTSATRPLRTADEYRWLLGLGRVLERTTRWVLRNVDPETPVLDPITREAGGLHRLREEFHAFVSGPDRELFEGRVAELMRAGADRTRARSVITLRFLDQLLEILHIAGEVGSDPVQAGDVFYRVSESMRLSWLREAIQDSASDDRWERRAARALTDDLGRAHHKLVVEGMRKGEFGSALDASFERLWVGGASDAERFRALVDEVRSEDPPSVSGLSVAVRELAALAERASR